jgi:hypothetical protein
MHINIASDPDRFGDLGAAAQRLSSVSFTHQQAPKLGGNAEAIAGLLVFECEQPSRKQRRGKGKTQVKTTALRSVMTVCNAAGRAPRS